MKNRAEIIKDLEDEILHRDSAIKSWQVEIETLNKSIIDLRALDGGAFTPVQQKPQIDSISDYPGYPLGGTLIEKYFYLEDITLRVWRAEDMKKLIRKIEGRERAEENLRNLPQRNHTLMKNCRLIQLKYFNNNHHCFYTTRKEWIFLENGKSPFILPQHQPEANQLIGLSEEQRKPEFITWAGIN